MWLLFATTGMRRGEVAGLAWGDVDLLAAQVRIAWTLGVVQSKPTWKPRPKSAAGERLMALDPTTIQALREHRKRQTEERLLVGSAWQRRQTDWRGEHRDDLVFTWPDGSLIHPQRLSKWFARHCERAGLPPDSPARCSPHVCVGGAGQCDRLARDETALPAAGTRQHRDHVGHLLACTAGRRRASRLTHSHASSSAT